MQKEPRVDTKFSGSLTPQLEGAPRTAAHTGRCSPSALQKPASKEGKHHF